MNMMNRLGVLLAWGNFLYVLALISNPVRSSQMAECAPVVAWLQHLLVYTHSLTPQLP